MCIFAGILAFINCWNVRWATAVQDVFTYAKLLALFIIMATGVVQLGKGGSIKLICKFELSLCIHGSRFLRKY